MGSRALIFGVSGQDGAYLAKLLLEKGYEVHGTTRGPAGEAPRNLTGLGIGGGVRIHSAHPANRQAVEAAIAEVRPDEIYYLAAQSSVFRSFEEPAGTFEGIAIGLINVLEAMRAAGSAARLLNAASGDCFGEASADAPANEATRFNPRSPYAAAKCAAHHQLSATRIAYSQFACSAILFNHESRLRPETFAFGRMVATAKRIAAGSDERLKMGNVDIVRDWGWAPEYADAMWRMLQQERPLDLVIATGRSRRLADIVALCFERVGLDWRKHVEVNAGSLRPADIRKHHADPSRARELLHWEAEVGVEDMVARLMA